MRVYLRPAILEQTSNILKCGAGRPWIMRCNSPRGCKQALPDSIRVGMNDKRSKNTAEDHSTEDENDSANYKNSSRATRCKSLCGLCYRHSRADGSITSAHRGFALAIAAGGIADFYADA
jgi:hypothetical protein